MRRQLRRVTRLLLATTASVFAMLLTFAVTAAAGGPTPFDARLHHVTTGPTSTGTVLFSVVLVAAIVCAAIVYFVFEARRERRTRQATVTHLSTDRGKKQTHEAA